ncbi:hypothetical protein FRACA_200035 [Frankia canadensis]|uniref:Uncharacterized protein n=1 Tax=Frankia canadensis TaxID=1836972 RepID=A0A2I2KQ57_9ACTN|nr:hypothetical protein FRACA_200035 [Frankia canadensis]SOU55087.1 hypothetical protein FRACA_200035 [Frankia canadensis]
MAQRQHHPARVGGRDGRERGQVRRVRVRRARRDDGGQRRDDVGGGKRVAVVETDAWAQGERVGQAVGGDLVAAGKRRGDRPGVVALQQSLVDVVLQDVGDRDARAPGDVERARLEDLPDRDRRCRIRALRAGSGSGATRATAAGAEKKQDGRRECRDGRHHRRSPARSPCRPGGSDLHTQCPPCAVPNWWRECGFRAGTRVVGGTEKCRMEAVFTGELPAIATAERELAALATATARGWRLHGAQHTAHKPPRAAEFPGVSGCHCWEILWQCFRRNTPAG